MSKLLIDIDEIGDDEPKPSPIQSGIRMDRRESREVRREAQYYERLIPDILAQVGYDHWLRKESRPTGIEEFFTGQGPRQKIRILYTLYNRSNIYFRIDTMRLPYRVTVLSLQDKEILETLSAACGRRVVFKMRGYDKGVWLVLDRIGTLNAIPGLFTFKEAMAALPETASPLRYVSGVGENMKILAPDIEKMPHMLVAGGTRMGKSVYLHSTILQLMLHTKPSDLQFLMVDLKGGMELQDYRDLPYLWKPIVTKIEDTVIALKEYRAEMERRQGLFAGKARNLPEYNRYHPSAKLPYIVLVIDELAQILTNPDRECSNSAMLELGLILAVARATGGHCILCTQHPSTRVVDGYLKSNVDARVAFKTASASDSRVILDTSDAADISQQGRAVMLYGANRVMIQCPWISPSNIRKITNKLRELNEPKDKGNIVEDILDFAIDRSNGNLAYRALEIELRERYSQAELRAALSDLDNQTIEHRGTVYQVIPSRGGRDARRLERLEIAEIGDNHNDSGSW